MTAETLIDTTEIDPADWQSFEKFELTQYVLWEHPETGASIALLDFPKGSGIPSKHSHASNQFMYCLEGRYEYTDSNLELTPGCFYGNPKDHPHGPTIAHERSVLLEIYDGPHYYEMPDYHTESTIGKVQADETVTGNTYLVTAKAAQALPAEDDASYVAHQEFVAKIGGSYGHHFSAVLRSEDDSSSIGVSYLVYAADADSALSLAEQDPLASLYASTQIQLIRS